MLNNLFTYRDQRLTGWHFLTGLIRFQVICAIGAISNVGIATWIYDYDETWWIAGLGGALIGTVWNFVVSAALVWRQQVGDDRDLSAKSPRPALRAGPLPRGARCTGVEHGIFASPLRGEAGRDSGRRGDEARFDPPTGNARACRTRAPMLSARHDRGPHRQHP